MNPSGTSPHSPTRAASRALTLVIFALTALLAFVVSATAQSSGGVRNAQAWVDGTTLYVRAEVMAPSPCHGVAVQRVLHPRSYPPSAVIRLRFIDPPANVRCVTVVTPLPLTHAITDNGWVQRLTLVHPTSGRADIRVTPDR